MKASVLKAVSFERNRERNSAKAQRDKLCYSGFVDRRDSLYTEREERVVNEFSVSSQDGRGSNSKEL